VNDGSSSLSLSTIGNHITITDEESNGYVIVKPKAPQQQQQQHHQQQQNAPTNSQATSKFASKKTDSVANKPIRTDINLEKITSEPSYHNRQSNQQQQQQQYNNQDGQFYDSSLGVVLNIENLDRDTGDQKYQRRPIFEWASRWLR
jgi:hypothetical protein